MLVGVLVAVMATGFVGVRLIVAADGDISRFVVAGSDFVDPSAVDPPIHVFDSAGYDGQFYWRLAIDPGARQLEPVHGARLDQPLRLSRVSYPTLAWLLALGQPSLVVWSLVLVNIAMLGVIGGCSAAICRDRGIAPLHGVLVAMSSGLVMSMSRDLCEIVMVAGIVAGVLSLQRRRYTWAAAAFSLSVLAHEQALIVIGALGLARIARFVTRRATPGRIDLAWVVPLGAFGLWQVISGLLGDSVPVLGSGRQSLSAPFAGLVRAASEWVGGDLPRQSILVVPQLILVVWIALSAFRARRGLPEEERWLSTALALGSLVAVCLSYNVWKGPAELRQVVLVPVLGWLVLFGARVRPERLLVITSVAVCLATVGLRSLAV